MKKARLVRDPKLFNNPIARAVAQDKLRKILVSEKLKLYFRENGEDCSDFIEGFGMTLAVVGMAAEMDPAFGPEHLDVRILRGGLSAVESLAKTCKYDKAQTVALDRALIAAETLNAKVKSDFIIRSYLALIQKVI